MVQRTKNQNALEVGMWNAVCDRCGFKFKNVDLKKEWNDLMTCKDCWETRHPLDFVRGVPDDPSVAWTRPDSSTEGDVDIHGDEDATLTVGINTEIQYWDTALTATRFITLSTIGASKGDKFTIYKTASDLNTLALGGSKTLITSGDTSLAAVGLCIDDVDGRFIDDGVQVGDIIYRTFDNNFATISSIINNFVVDHIGNSLLFASAPPLDYAVYREVAPLKEITVPSVSTVEFDGIAWVLTNYYTLGL